MPGVYLSTRRFGGDESEELGIEIMTDMFSKLRSYVNLTTEYMLASVKS